MFYEGTKVCQVNRCSCKEQYTEVNFKGYLDCAISSGQRCVSRVIQRYMSKDDFRQSLSNYSELEQRRELAVYEVYEVHISEYEKYIADKTPLDVGCSSGKCGDNNRCTPGINSVFVTKDIPVGSRKGNTDIQSNKSRPIRSNGLVVGALVGVTAFLILMAAGALYYFYRHKVNPSGSSSLGFNLL
jgi:hypothetical protein